MTTKVEPDYKRAAEFAVSVVDDENPDIQNLGCAYLVAVKELEAQQEILDNIDRRLKLVIRTTKNSFLAKYFLKKMKTP